MRETNLTSAIDEVIELKLRAVDDYIKTIVKPLLDSVGSPEKLIGKPYEQWLQNDMQLMNNVYGKALEKFIAQKEIAHLNALEKQAKEL
jgi:hypothetical protein